MDRIDTGNFGAELAKHRATKGVTAEVVYPGEKDVKHASPTYFLIATLKPRAP